MTALFPPCEALHIAPSSAFATLQPCVRWCSTPRGRRSSYASSPIRSRGRRSCSCASTPAGSAAPTSTSLDGELTGRSSRSSRATRSSARSSAVGRGASPLPRGRPRRDRLARLGLRDVPLLRERPGEPLPERALHRVHAGRRLRRARRRRGALRLPPPRARHRRAHGAAPLRGAHRLPRAAARGRRGADRPLRLRRLRPHRRPGRAWQGRRVFAFSAAATPRRSASPARSAPLDGRERRASAGGARRRAHLRARRRARPARARRGRPRAARSSAPGST